MTVKTISWLNFGTYPGYCMFSCGYSYDELIKWFVKQHKNKNKESLPWMNALMQFEKEAREGGNRYFYVQMQNRKDGKFKYYFFVMITDPFDFSDFHYVKLAHEMVHICQCYLPDILDRNKEREAEAYLHSHLMSQALKALRN